MTDDLENGGGAPPSRYIFRKIYGKVFQKKYLVMIIAVFTFLVYSQTVSLNLNMHYVSQIVYPVSGERLAVLPSDEKRNRGLPDFERIKLKSRTVEPQSIEKVTHAKNALLDESVFSSYKFSDMNSGPFNLVEYEIDVAELDVPTKILGKGVSGEQNLRNIQDSGRLEKTEAHESDSDKNVTNLQKVNQSDSVRTESRLSIIQKSNSANAEISDSSKHADSNTKTGLTHSVKHPATEERNEDETAAHPNTSVIATTHSPPFTTPVGGPRAGIPPKPDITNRNSSSYKTIVFYTEFFGGSWSAYLRNGRTDLALHGCPVTQCVFSFDPAEASKADAVIFHETGFDPDYVPMTRKPHQRYIWMNAEAPSPEHKNKFDTRHGSPGFFNWTATYHRASEVTMPYGGLAPRGEDRLPSRLFPLDRNTAAYKNYVKDLANGTRLQDEPNVTQYLPDGCNLETYFQRPKLAAWMVSNCHTNGGREVYMKELQKYIHVDIYGRCGNLICGKNHLDVFCYTDVLQPKYKFYLSFENSWCNDYITEKVWNAMLYGLVPVVYGGTNYEEFLPPNSYVDATKLSPKELGRELARIATSAEEYAKYHLWRKYWRVLVPSPMCDICERLHSDVTESQVANLWDWWYNINNCSVPYPGRKDPISSAMSFFEQLGNGFEFINNLFDNVRKSKQG